MKNNEDDMWEMTCAENLVKMNYKNEIEPLAKTRTQGQYIAVTARPDISASIQLPTPSQRNPTAEEISTLDRTVRHCIKQ